MKFVRLTRSVRKTGKKFREARMLVRALRFPYQPVAAHLIPMRRCNLACTYCNEFDDHSPPVPTSDVLERVDRLAALGTGIITISGGEPLLHPDLDQIISRIRAHGAIATLITNGYLLSRDRIRRLNRAGLDHLQISIDNVLPDDVSKKSLKLLDQKLRWLAEDSEFDVTVNSVVGSGVRNPDDALTIARRARELGFSTTVGIIHNHNGQLLPLDDHQRSILEQIVAIGKSTFDFANYNRFQRNLANAQPNEWHCGAGSRYLYVCEDGRVHWCSQQRGHPGIPLEQYGPDDLRRQYHAVKRCAPMCTVGCVHRVAQVDELRANPQQTLTQWFTVSPIQDQQPALPASVRILMWAFVTSPRRDLFRSVASRVFGGGS
ncbi:MAG TPA: radical SAM protein [Vicinamibacterales bacterium]|jgi:MoaA/NifB/PqqE/SkfB family radical SAM enzyme